RGGRSTSPSISPFDAPQKDQLFGEPVRWSCQSETLRTRPGQTPSSANRPPPSASHEESMRRPCPCSFLQIYPSIAQSLRLELRSSRRRLLCRSGSKRCRRPPPLGMQGDVAHLRPSIAPST